MEAGNKTLDIVEQAEPRADHIIALLQFLPYRLYRVHACRDCEM